MHHASFFCEATLIEIGVYDPSEVQVVQPDFEQILVFNTMRVGDVGVLRYENDGDTLRFA